MLLTFAECTTCGTDTDNTGTKKCHDCWEVERRLEKYLARGGANALTFVMKLATAAAQSVVKAAFAEATKKNLGGG